MLGSFGWPDTPLKSSLRGGMAWRKRKEDEEVDNSGSPSIRVRAPSAGQLTFYQRPLSNHCAGSHKTLLTESAHALLLCYKPAPCIRTR